MSLKEIIAGATLMLILTYPLLAPTSKMTYPETRRVEQSDIFPCIR